MANHVAILVWPEVSVYNSTFKLSREMTAIGIRITYITTDKWRSFIEKQGFAAYIVSGFQVQSDEYSFRERGIRAQSALDRLRGEFDSAWLRTVDLVLLQSTRWYWSLIFQESGIRFIALTSNLGSIRRPNIPPIFSPMKPPAELTIVWRIRCYLAWLSLSHFGSFRHYNRGIELPSPRSSIPVASTMRRSLLFFIHALLERHRHPIFALLEKRMKEARISFGRGDYGTRLSSVELVCGPEELDFPEAAHDARRIYLGPNVDIDRVEDAFDWGDIEENSEVVYCTLGSHRTYWNSEVTSRLHGALMAVTRKYRDLTFILQVNEEHMTGNIPDNVIRSTWFPQLQALKRSTVCVSHGGFGTVKEASYWGIPQLILPCGVDQFGNAARVEYHGIGIRMDIRKVTQESLSQNLDRLLNEPPYRQKAADLGVRLRGKNVDALQRALSHPQVNRCLT